MEAAAPAERAGLFTIKMHEALRHARHSVETDRTGFRNISITTLQTLDLPFEGDASGGPGIIGVTRLRDKRLSSRVYVPACPSRPARTGYR